MAHSLYTYRYMARVVLEAETPLAVGSGENNILTDALVATDVNGLPYIPGTSIAGVVRSMLDKSCADSFFGIKGVDNMQGEGSRIIFTEAKIVNSKGVVMDGLLSKAALSDSLLKHYSDLPVRQHVRINARGTTDQGGKFDEQVVFAGTRFCFEIEMVGTKEDAHYFDDALNQIHDQSFRLGSGTRNGFGKMSIIASETKTRTLDLTLDQDRAEYLGKTSALDSDYWKSHGGSFKRNGSSSKMWTTYPLTVSPLNFFHVGSGFGDEDVDMAPVKARRVDWSSGVGVLKDNLVLIPGSAIKGALSHRTAFHWNRLHDCYAGDPNTKTGNVNPAVRLLFGYEDQHSRTQRRGIVMISDIIDAPADDKVIYHVKIDRFTGGFSKGALFSEKSTFGQGRQYHTTISIASKEVCCLTDDERDVYDEALQAFWYAVDDLCNGRLPLGGSTSKGNGIFTGTNPNPPKK